MVIRSKIDIPHYCVNQCQGHFEHMYDACKFHKCHVVAACKHFQQLNSQHVLCANDGLYETRFWKINRKIFVPFLMLRSSTVVCHSATITFSLPVLVFYDFVPSVSVTSMGYIFVIGQGLPGLFLLFQSFNTFRV